MEKKVKYYFLYKFVTIPYPFIAMLRSAHQQSITNRGDEFERLDEIIKQNKDFKLNPLIPRSQTFLIEDNKILCGSPLDNKMIMNIFIDYIKN